MLKGLKKLFQGKSAEEDAAKKAKAAVSADAEGEGKEKKKKKKKKDKEKKSKIKAVYIEKLTEVAGMSPEEAERALAEAKEKLGIKPDQYLKYRVYDVPEEEQPAWAEQIATLDKQRKERMQAKKEMLYNRILESTDLTREQAEAMVRHAKKDLGIAIGEFVSGKYYNMTDEEMLQAHEELIARNREIAEEKHAKRVERFAAIMEIPEDEAEAHLKEASERLGISEDMYVGYRLYRIPVEEQKDHLREVLEKAENRRQRRRDAMNQRVSRVAMRTGWSLAEAEQAMYDAFDRHKITFAEYLVNKYYLLSDEEQAAAHEEIVRKREEALENERENCINAVVENCGCSRDEAIEMIEKCRTRIRITYKSYRRYRFFEIPEEEQEERYREIVKQIQERTQIQIRDNDKFLEKIAEETGWSNEEILEKLVDAEERCGASWKDYFAYKFWDVDEEEQGDYFTAGMQRALTRRFDELSNRDIFVNKELFLEKFTDVLGRQWAISTQISREEFKEKFADCQKVLYKPSNNGNAGSGIEVFDMSEPDKAFDAISELPRGIVEEYLIQHPVMSGLYPHSVNTMRIASVCWADEETGEDHFEIAYATLRMGSGGSNVDNFTTGGMVASIDLDTGITLTDGVDISGRTYPKHPDTGTVIKGFKIPFFKESLELIKAGGSHIHGYIGWDIAITEKGPVLIEANIDPGNRLLQMAWIPEERGMAHVMEKYLKMTDFYD